MRADRMGRRAFLRAGAAAVGVVGASSLLTACGSGAAGPGPAPSTAPAAGGTLRAAFVGGGATETLNHLMGPTALDYVRARARHGALGAVDPSAPDGVRYDLLEGIDVSDDLTEYTLRLRPGLTFTDGSPLTVRDVVHSLAAPVTLGSLPFLKNAVSAFDLDAARVEGDLTAVLPARRPLVDGRLLLCQSNLVFREGTTAFTADMPTCGPFRMTAFDPGQGSTFVRHEGYAAPAGAQGPFLDGLELRSIADSTARAAALSGGQVDYADDLAPATARTLEGDGAVRITATEAPFVNQLSFTMNVAREPFGDPRVREAFKLAVDRQRIVDTVFFGRAEVGNDLPSVGFPSYAGDIAQRAFDPDRARALLAEAGVAGVAVTLTTGPEIPGMAETATVLVENLEAVGVNATLDQLPAGQLYADFPAYTQLQFAGGYNPPQPVLTAYLSTRAAGSPTTFGFDRPDIDELVTTARTSTDPAERDAAIAEAQRRTWAEGNTIIPVFKAAANAQTAAVQGITYAPFADFTGASVR
ncbi:ABC transporter substrate-binding protein [Pseudonocardia sp. MH-G8]|uniref:ABC transporter substrate-binding protein n=1 Tax=Pseudonocardia sp. MH-G8 TaxID=1854588 RepID=UPI001E3A056B|nr:ABC transporter substrate-binding protein [Pseudonocardia sp. MH-G8]